MMGVICNSMVVICVDRSSRGKKIQPRNREWVTAIEYMSSDSFVLPLFLVVQGVNYLASWYTECNLPFSQVIKTSPNGWTDNDITLQQIQHFDKYIIVRRERGYRMVVLDGYKSHLSIQFEEFCKEKNIITFCLFTYLSHLTQPLNIRCFNILKRSYGQQFETFIKAYINYIIKTEFFIAFKTVHLVIITASNI